MLSVHIGVRVRAILARAFGLAVALVLLAPILLGPAIGPITHALGGEAKHLCACGMVAGTCGCPECEKAERQRHREDAPKAYPVAKSQCGGNDTPVAFAPLPLAAPAEGCPLLPKVTAEVNLPVPTQPWASLEPIKPPTPPPEVAALRS